MTIKSNLVKSLKKFANLAQVIPTTDRKLLLEITNVTQTVCVDVSGIDDGNYGIDVRDGLQRLPFEDFTFKIKAKAGEQWVRVIRLNKDVIRIVKYNPFTIASELAGSYMVDMAVDIDFAKEKVQMKYPDEAFISKDVTPANVESTVTAIVTIALSMANKMMESSQEIQFKPNKKNYTYSKMPKALREKYVEYTYSKPKVKAVFTEEETVIVNGKREHASPREHIRCGHWRNYKSGKKVWIKSSHINKNSTDGKIEKDYQY